MGSLIEKFKNVRYPNRIRQVKRDYPLPKVKAANDNPAVHLDLGNIKSKPDLYMRDPLVDAFRYCMESSPEYRRMMQNKVCFGEVRERHDDIEKFMNEAIFEVVDDER